MSPVHAFGEIRRLGYVVPAGRLHAHLDHWVHTLGVGPWLLVEHPRVSDLVHLGQPGTVDLSVAVTQLGGMQVALFAQHDRRPSAYLEFLERTGGQGGLHHLAYWPRDLSLAERQAEDMGWELWTAGCIEGVGRFRQYLTEDHPGTVFELGEVSPELASVVDDELEGLARRFDPSVDDPVLRLGSQA